MTTSKPFSQMTLFGPKVLIMNMPFKGKGKDENGGQRIYSKNTATDTPTES